MFFVVFTDILGNHVDCAGQAKITLGSLFGFTDLGLFFVVKVYIVQICKVVFFYLSVECTRFQHCTLSMKKKKKLIQIIHSFSNLHAQEQNVFLLTSKDEYTFARR